VVGRHRRRGVEHLLHAFGNHLAHGAATLGGFDLEPSVQRVVELDGGFHASKLPISEKPATNRL